MSTEVDDLADLTQQLREKPEVLAIVDHGRGLSVENLAAELLDGIREDFESGRWREWIGVGR